MDKHGKDKLTRMIQAQSDVERNRDIPSLPLHSIHIEFSCGCALDYDSDRPTNTYVGQLTHCTKHRQNVTVSYVSNRK